MTRETLIRALDEGVPHGETIANLIEAFTLTVVEAHIERNGGAIARSAREMGRTREWLSKFRRRAGSDVESNPERPIPEDWRERLEAARR